MVAELGSTPGAGPSPSEPTEASPSRTVDWAKVREDTESGEFTLNAIADSYGITLAELRRHARANKWGPPGLPASEERRLIIEQLYGVLERQIRHLRTTQMTATGDKEVAALHKLAATLDTLVELDGHSGAGRPQAQETKDIQDLRRKIAERLEALKLT